MSNDTGIKYPGVTTSTGKVHINYMYKTFYGHTPNVNGLLNLDRNDTHVHNIDAKRCEVNNDSATYLWHCRLGHTSVKRMKELHKDGFPESLDYESFDD